MQPVARDVYLKVHARKDVGPGQLAQRIRQEIIAVFDGLHGRRRVAGRANGPPFFGLDVQVGYPLQTETNTHTLLFSSEPAAVPHQEPPVALAHLPVPARVVAGHYARVNLKPVAGAFGLLIVQGRADHTVPTVLVGRLVVLVEPLRLGRAVSSG